ncbi:MAG: chemotaxis protein CheW [Herbinix sp.]|nr:chemotaxis protein CheW [Herbinix sp.]
MEALDTKQFIIAYLNSEPFGIEIKYIDNIIVMQSITRVPKSQSYFRGVINLRGDIVPVMSLGSKLGIPDTELTSKARIIIVRPEQQAAPVGLIVDEVKEVITLEQNAIEKINYDDKENKGNYSIGIGKYGTDLINLLNISAIVIDKETNI